MKVKDLTDNQIKQAMENVASENRVSEVYHDSLVASAFYWCNSVEGYDYWSKIVETFNNK